MAYDSTPSATHNPATGGTPTAAWGDIINENFAVLGGVWTAFTPTWTASSVNPAIGNGTITGAYIKIGKTLKFRVRIAMGSTTTFGTGDWRITLPGSSTSVATAQVTGPALALDAGSTYYTGVLSCAASGTYVTVNSHNNANNWGTAQPHTWANNDVLTFTAELEIA